MKGGKVHGGGAGAGRAEWTGHCPPHGKTAMGNEISGKKCAGPDDSAATPRLMRGRLYWERMDWRLRAKSAAPHRNERPDGRLKHGRGHGLGLGMG